MGPELSARLWSLYATSHFRGGQPQAWRGDFHIITACNPGGELLTAGANRIRDRQLEAELNRLRLPGRVLWVGSPDFQHQERSWALWCERPLALQLGRQFGQNALFAVKAGQLWLLPCLLAAPPRYLGPFAARWRQG